MGVGEGGEGGRGKKKTKERKAHLSLTRIVLELHMGQGVVNSASFCSQKSPNLTRTVSYMATISLEVLTVDPYCLR